MESQPHEMREVKRESPTPNETMATANASQNTENQQIHGLDETTALRGLQAEIRDQVDLERHIGREADRMLLEQANERDQARLEKTRSQIDKLQSQLRKSREQVSRPVGTTQRTRLKVDIDRMQNQIEALQGDVAAIEERIIGREQQTHEGDVPDTGAGRLPNESQRDFLIRTGKITPFSKFGLSAHGESSTTLRGALYDAEDEPEDAEIVQIKEIPQLMSHRHLRQPGFAQQFTDSSASEATESDSPHKRRKLLNKTPVAAGSAERESSGSNWEEQLSPADEAEESSEFLDGDSDSMPNTEGRKPPKPRRSHLVDDNDVQDFRGVDDGNEAIFRARFRKWALRRRRARQHAEDSHMDIQNRAPDEDVDEQSLTDEMYLPHPEIPDAQFDGGYRIPGDIYPNLFDYQKTAVQWLHELYSQQVGGIIGDEMGLGKTIQVIAFLAGLHYTKKLDKPIIVVCPATVMKQWVNEFHRWWPPFRVTILHSSGSGMVNIRNESSRDDDLMDQMWDPRARQKPLTPAQRAIKKLLSPIFEHTGVLVTTYSGLQTYAALLIPVDWQYAILDEGHKIRNPNTAITIYCKEIRTPNRIILSGTPMQNNLIELWSLFDFVFPMRLGTLVNFRNQFEIPIRQGGYANASNLQVQTAFKCAETLKDAISPYLLQRFKVDVAADLPKKTEQVLFCKLTKLQRQEYQRFLGSGDLDAILNGKRQVLYGVDILRKICNHPDLQNHRHLSTMPGYDYGNPEKSGKMQVVGSLLELWKDTGHKALLFAQHRIMLDVLEKFIRSIQGLKYRRMDGNTPIHIRQNMVDEFNTDPDLHVFLLTTKVGGLGVNLMGADRVIIYDPDWNPSTDLQARERAWRLGQKREVTIYRLMTAGTIEEKIYHRQIFKQFLTNKILKDPKQRQTFHLSDLHDLFSLGNEGEPTETSTLFRDAEVKYSANKSTASKKNGSLPETKGGEVGVEKVEDLAGVSSMERYADEPAGYSEGAGTTNSEARVMEGIFARSGIHSALEHDQIIGGTKAVKADPVMIEQEAKKVAAEAARELRKAGELARTIPIGQPTWTGQFGISGRPQGTTPQRAFAFSGRSRGTALSSAGLLSGLHTRQTGMSSRETTPGAGTASPGRVSSSTPASRPSTPTLPRGKEFAKLIRDFLQAHGGSVYTQMLIDHFNRLCTTPQATFEFKETLKAIARLDRGGRGRGRWVLRDEYKG